MPRYKRLNPFRGRDNRYFLKLKCINPLSPKSDQHQISPLISMLCKTEWSWELRTWSHKMNLPDILSTSPHYFCGKWNGASNENSNFDSNLRMLILLGAMSFGSISYETHTTLAKAMNKWVGVSTVVPLLTWKSISLKRTDELKELKIVYSIFVAQEWTGEKEIWATTSAAATKMWNSLARVVPDCPSCQSMRNLCVHEFWRNVSKLKKEKK